jgi:hypothetical protein
VPLLWVETEHFRIGSSLDAYRPAEREERKRLAAELKALAERLPNVDQRARELDPWLRLHLYASRLEGLWDRFHEAFGLRPDDFGSGGPGAGGGPGRGPVLGMRGKLLALFVQKESSLARYTATWCGTQSTYSWRQHFHGSDSFFFGIAADAMEGGLATDSALHFAAVYNVALNMVSGCRGYFFETPVWPAHGLARWFARPIDETVLLYTSGAGEALRGEEESNWEPKVRARALHRHFPALAEMVAWERLADLSFADHMIAWSKADFLMRRGPETARALLYALEEPIPWDAPGREERLRGQALRAVERATGLDAEAFDEAWCAWVEATYSKR